MPPSIFITLILSALLLFYIIFSYFRTKVPFVATPTTELDFITSHLPITSSSVLYDLGCGRGKFLFAVEKYRPQKMVGFELSPLHAWYAWAKARIFGSKVSVLNQDFFGANIADATIIYLFLVPAIVQKTWLKIAAECSPGTLVVTLCDTITGQSPVRTISQHPDQPTGKFYFYEVPERSITHSTSLPSQGRERERGLATGHNELWIQNTKIHSA